MIRVDYGVANTSGAVLVSFNMLLGSSDNDISLGRCSRLHPSSQPADASWPAAMSLFLRQPTSGNSGYLLLPTRRAVVG
jgi:hypothetical protein